ncbi:MAG: PAS domain S-box protein [Prolixibacteraceae bacterium]|nr:PAS domain S-box protein [Prolixibacteraceae bacterium]
MKPASNSDSILRFLQDGFLRADNDGYITMANEAIAVMCGYSSPEEMIGMNMKMLYANPDERNYMISEIKTEGKLTNYELELQRKDGSRFWSLNNIKTFRDEKGNLLGTEGVIRDISKLRETEEKLKHTNKVLASIRNVNQLINVEKDKAKLMQGICNNLTENRGYFNVWIMLLDDKGKFASVYQSGLGDEFKLLEKRLENNDFMSCTVKALMQKDVVVISNLRESCTDCPLAELYEERGAMTTPIIHNEKLYGLITNSIPKKFITQYNADLFKEVANDVGLALYNLDTTEQKRRLTEVVNSLPHPISLISSDYKYLAVNQVYADFYKVSAEEITGVKLSEFLGEEVYINEVKPHLDLCLRGEVVECELQTVFAGKGRMWMKMEYHPFYDEDGKITGVMLHGFDITKRKKIEIDLKQKSQLLNDTGEIARIGGWEVDVATNKLTWSDETYRIHEVPMDYEPIVDTAVNFFHPGDRPLLLKALKNAIEKVEPYDLILRFITAKGKHLIAHTTCRPEVNDGKVMKLKGTFQDVTEWKKAEEKLQAANQQLLAANQQLTANEQQLRAANQQLTANEQQLRAANQQLMALNQQLTANEQQLQANQKELKEERDKAQQYMDIAGVMFLVINEDGEVTLINRKGADILGYTPDEIIGKNWFDHFIPATDRKEIKPIFKKIIAGEIKQFEYNENPIIAKDGSEKIIAWHNAILKHRNGKIIGSLSSGEDITERKKAEENILNLQKLLKEAERIGNIGGWEFDVKTMTQTWTEETFRIMEIETQDGEPKVPDGLGFIDQPYRDMAEKAIQEAIRNGTSYDQEWLITTAKGNKRWVHAVAAANKKNNQIVSISGSFQDISNRKKAENSLKESEDKFRSLFNQSPQGIYIHDLDGQITEVNQVACQQLGYTEEELLNLSVFDLHPKSEETINLPKAEILKQWKNWKPGLIHTVIADHRRKDGTVFPVEVTTGQVQFGGRRLILSMAQNITDRKQAEEQLKDSEAKFRSYVNNAPDGMFIADETGRYIEVNQAACEITGYSEKELTQKYIPDLLQESEVEKGIQHFKEVQQNKLAHCEIGFLTKKGEKRFWQVAAVKLSNTRFLGFVKDVTERKQAAEELEHSHKLMQYIIEHTNSAVAVHDLDMRYVYVSQQYIDQYNLNGMDIIGRHHYDVFPDLPQKWRDVHKRVLKGEIISADEDDYKKEDGTIEWTRWECRPWYNLKGEINGLIVYTEVITEEKNMQDALKESEAKLKNIIEHSTNLFDSHSTDEKVSFISPQVREYLGYEPEEVMQNWTDFITDNPINEKAIEYTRKAIQTGERQPTYELEMLRKDGRKIIVEVREAPVIENGKVVSIVGSLADITERKIAEEALKKSRRDLQAIISNSPICTKIIDVDFNLQYMSESGMKQLKINDVEEFYGKPYPLYFFPEQFKLDMAEKLKEVKKTLKTMELEGELADIAGNRLWYHHIMAPVKDDKGKLEYILVVSMDITQRKKAENELVDAKDKAEESDRLKSAFLANMSHEIRTPMNGILGFAELLREPDLRTDQQLEYVSIIEKSGERMLNIINEIIDISKIESGTMEVNLKEVNINNQLDYMLSFFKPEAEHKGLDLILKNTLTDEEAKIITDSEKVLAVLMNLMKNAIKYTNKGFIEFGCKFTKNRNAKLLQFSVKDTGVGIAIERQKAIFDRFIQADIEDINARQGAGLGLAISKAYIEMLGGELWLESDPDGTSGGKGSVFSFTIPYKPLMNEETEAAKESEIEDNSLNQKLKMIIAEDDESSRDFISIIVKDFSKEVIVTKTGTETIEACRANPDIDLIFMDIQMPEMNGYKATEQIRQFNKDVIIIAQTAYGLTGDREKALEAGCNDYIAKPIKKAKLLELIQKYFN